MADIKGLVASINKMFGEDTLSFVKDMKFTEIKRTPSGSLFLDWALGSTKDGVAGWPFGRMIELYGAPSSGKSLISMKTIAESQKLGLSCAYLDVEKAFDKDFAKKLGIDIDKLILTQVTTGEKAMDIACEILRSKEIDVMVIDSVASLVPKAELEETLEKATMAQTARLMSKALRKLTALNSQTVVIFINQLRTNPNASYGANPEYTPGGKSLGYYSSLRVEIRRGDWLVDKNKQKIGQVIKFKVVKNKTSAPYKDGYFKFYYDGTIDKADELISLAILRDKLTRKGAYYYFGEEGFRGREDLESQLKTNDELYERLRKEVFENGTKKDTAK